MSDYFDNQDAPSPAPSGIAHRLEKWFPQISKDKIDHIDRYYDELMKFNRTINLISSNSVKSADIVHFADSISACQIIEPALILDAPVYDFGSGNGFPGLIFGILFPKTKVILIERDSKKAEFLKHLRGILNLRSVEVHNMEAALRVALSHLNGSH